MKGREQWEQDVRDRQRNVVFPDTVQNEARFYRKVISGDGNLTLVQRIGSLLLGSVFLTLAGVQIWTAVYSGRMLRDLGNSVFSALVAGLGIALVMGAIGLAIGYFGWKLVLAGLRTRSKADLGASGPQRD